MLLSYRSLKSLLILFVIATAGVICTYILGGLEDNFNQKLSIIDAIYFTLTALTTSIYGDILPTTPVAKLYVVVLSILSIGAFANAVVNITSDLVAKRVETLTKKLEETEKEFQKPHILLIGGGPVNYLLARLLKNRKQRYVLLVSNKQRVERLRKEGINAYFLADLSEEELSKFYPNKASLIVVDIKDISDMMYTVLLLFDIANDAKIISIVYNKEAEKRIQALKKIKEVRTVNPDEIVANQLLTEFST